MDSHSPKVIPRVAVPLTRPDLHASDIEAMTEAVRKGAIAQGEAVSRFEVAFSELLNVDAGVATNSGTSAIVLALRVLGVGAGDEVIVPSYTCVAVLHAVVQCGAMPVLIDNECDAFRMDYNLSTNEVRKAITAKTRAILVPHMFGTAADIISIKGFGIPVIEDITLSVGASTRQGKKVGSIGDMAVCSFHASKMLACGEGGMLLGSASLVARARELNGWELEQVEQRFEAPLKPYALRYGFRLSDIHASCGLSQLVRLTETIERRRDLARRYTDALKGIDGIVLPDVTLPGRVYFRFILSVLDRNIVDLLYALADEGIEAGRGVYPPLHHFFKQDRERFRGAEAASRSNLSIPLYPSLSEFELDHVLSVTKNVLTRQ